MNNKFLVFQSDFGREGGSVSQMYGIALQVDPDIRIFDITHNIPQFNTWKGSYSLYQSCYAWAKGTVFVSVIDPGIGKNRRRVVALTKAGHYIVTPDNCSLSHINKYVGIVELREIDESVNRLTGSEESNIFLGRDVFAYTGARLASGEINFEEVGPKLDVKSVCSFELSNPRLIGSEAIGSIDIVDGHFGMLWSNIPIEYFEKLNVQFGDYVNVIIYKDRKQMYKSRILYGKSFASVRKGEDLLYNNEIGNLAIATNLENFAKKYNLKAGIGWTISLITI
ncbi:MAG: SAM-dependent chlorinase/fluorinase [Candidatus Izimaplasma sp.]|nr:SAM-dependent chlorinase/fluorinase [Candidatus Izimaplasma bacterium]